MIIDLRGAWAWYESTMRLVQAARVLGIKHWDSMPWDGPLGRDNLLRHLTGAQLEEWSDCVQADLNDLCVLLLFSVFEARMREQALKDVKTEVKSLHHPALLYAVDGLVDALEHGSFYRVIEAYKKADPDLAEGVNQVRKYRNWVAHGRRDDPECNVDPLTAYLRLSRFLALVEKP